MNHGLERVQQPRVWLEMSVEELRVLCDLANSGRYYWNHGSKEEDADLKVDVHQGLLGAYDHARSAALDYLGATHRQSVD